MLLHQPEPTGPQVPAPADRPLCPTTYTWPSKTSRDCLYEGVRINSHLYSRLAYKELLVKAKQVSAAKVDFFLAVLNVQDIPLPIQSASFSLEIRSTEFLLSSRGL